MIKRLFLLVVGLIAVSQWCISQRKVVGYSAYLSMGLCSPIASKSETSELAFLDIANETESNLGFDLVGVIYYRRIGLNLGFGYYKYVFDAEKFDTQQRGFYPEDSVNTYMSKKVRNIPLYVGISYYLKFGDFYIEPRILVRLNKIISPDIVDTYFWDNDNLLQSINYEKNTTYRLDYVPALSLSYYYPVSRELKIGIQVSYEYSFSHPQFEYARREINLEGETIDESTIEMKTDYSCSKFSLGLIVRFN